MIITFEPTLVQFLTLLVSFALPVLVGLVTKQTTHAGLKAVLLATLSLIAGVASEALAAAQQGEAFDFFASVYSFAGVFIVAVATHYGVWKPTGVSAAAQAVGDGSHRA
jgi:hypothetical protein